MLDPVSLPAEVCRAKRIEMDRLDAARMFRALIAIDRGETPAPGTVRVPIVEEEDRRLDLVEQGHRSPAAPSRTRTRGLPASGSSGGSPDVLQG